MAHLSARHGDAKRRRDELFRERSLVIAAKTGYPFDFQAKKKPADQSSRGASESTGTHATALAATGALESVGARRFTAEELAEATRRCQDRIHSAREKELEMRRRQWQQEQERQQRSDAAGLEAPGLAAKRLRERKLKARHAQEESINALITQQPSSIDAMNIARMLSPRFEERVEFTPSVTKHSIEDERVKSLLGSARIGSYYQ